MAIYEVAYCTREQVQRALNLADVPRFNERVDQAIMAGARDVEGLLHRRFYPETKTVKFDQPETEYLWLYEQELSGPPTLISSGGDEMVVDTDVLLRPRLGPPYTWLEARFGGQVYWQSETTPQNAIEITGDFGYPVTEVPAAELAASMTGSAVQLTLTDSSLAGVGSLVLIGSERMLISEKTMAGTTATLSTDLAASKSAVSVTVSDGTLINPGEMILVGSERMQVQYVTGDTLTVERAVNASALAAHTSGDTVYAPRLATVRRGLLGTSAAAHSSGDTVTLLKAPSLVSELNLAYAINNVQQALSAYARPVGSGDNQRDQAGRGVQDIAEDAYTRYGRKVRTRAVM